MCILDGNTGGASSQASGSQRDCKLDISRQQRPWKQSHQDLLKEIASFCFCISEHVHELLMTYIVVRAWENRPRANSAAMAADVPGPVGSERLCRWRKVPSRTPKQVRKLLGLDRPEFRTKAWDASCPVTFLTVATFVFYVTRSLMDSHKDAPIDWTEVAVHIWKERQRTLVSQRCSYFGYSSQWYEKTESFLRPAN